MVRSGCFLNGHGDDQCEGDDEQQSPPTKDEPERRDDERGVAVGPSRLRLAFLRVQIAMERPACGGLFGTVPPWEYAKQADPLDLLRPAVDAYESGESGAGNPVRIRFANMGADSSHAVTEFDANGATLWDSVNMRYVYHQATIVINSDTWNNVTQTQNAVTLLHELGHVYGLFNDGAQYHNWLNIPNGTPYTRSTRIVADGHPNDWQSYLLSTRNSELITNACFK
jgi:hypothetical protein